MPLTPPTPWQGGRFAVGGSVALTGVPHTAWQPCLALCHSLPVLSGPLWGSDGAGDPATRVGEGTGPVPMCCVWDSPVGLATHSTAVTPSGSLSLFEGSSAQGDSGKRQVLMEVKKLLSDHLTSG